MGVQPVNKHTIHMTDNKDAEADYTRPNDLSP
jgi:hypothetical protein